MFCSPSVKLHRHFSALTMMHQKYLSFYINSAYDFIGGKNHSVLTVLTLNAWGLNYSGSTQSVSWLLMPWLLTSPRHQHHWYWPCRIGKFLSYVRKDFNYLCQLSTYRVNMLINSFLSPGALKSCLSLITVFRNSVLSPSSVPTYKL